MRAGNIKVVSPVVLFWKEGLANAKHIKDLDLHIEQSSKKEET